MERARYMNQLKLDIVANASLQRDLNFSSPEGEMMR